MERLSHNQLVDRVLIAHSDTVDTIGDAHFFAGRKVSIDHNTVRSMCIADQPWSFNDQVRTVFDVAINTNFSPALDDKTGIRNFNNWFWGELCLVEDVKPPYGCTCSWKGVHQQYPKQKVGGILIENQRRVVKDDPADASGSLNPEALLALGACHLIESERFRKMHEQQLKKAPADISSLFLEKASSKCKEAYKQWLTANLLNAEQTRNQLRSWLIQYALNNGTISRASDIEKIKQFRSGQQARLSDQWYRLLIDSGLYPNTEPLASPIALTQRLAGIASQFTRINHHYPYSAHDSQVLLFSRYEFLSGCMRDKPGYLSEPNHEYGMLYRALDIAILDDWARTSHELTKINLDMAGKPTANRTTSTPGSKLTRAVTQRTVSWWSEDFTRDTPVNQVEFVRNKQAVFVRTKKAGQAASSASLLTGHKPFPEPENLVTAFATVFNVMTYQRPTDKTRIYNVPQHHGKMMKAFQLLKQAVSSEPPLPDNLHGYACFLMAWLHEQQLINHPSPEKAATLYEQAASRGKFIPLNLRAGDLLAKIGDYGNACRCYEQMHQQLQTLVDSPDGNPATAESGYLSPSFQDYLRSKIEYARIKAKDTRYLRSLPPEDIQQYINGDKDNSHGKPAGQRTNSRAGNQSRIYPVSQQQCLPEDPPVLFQEKGVGNDTSSAVSKTLSTPVTGQTPGFAPPAVRQDTPRQPHQKTVNPAHEKEHRADLSRFVRNRLTSQWDCSVHNLLKQFFDRKKQLIYTHDQQIAWLRPELDKIRRKRGSEVLMEHLAWEHIGAAEQPLYHDVGHGQESAVNGCAEHLNRARDLLQQSIIRKTGIQYRQLPDPETFEADVLSIVERVTPSLSPIEITEWLFGIVCQARSLGHVFSTFKLLYPRSEHINSLNRGWFSLKRLYRTP
ncbi:SEL1-like repeat protein [Endozoicomonas sp. SESOKO1]|uniref:SEL1-like repeat protein n=1 Tax=Endozoicomonas sp. SESOKO1 TaxID=2828742 RepID=UPI002148CF88|nr:SEL1-like repeat protein [Endozoicomonas sp. SESOKO1]